MGSYAGKDQFLVDFTEDENGVSVGVSYLEKKEMVLLTFFDSGDAQSGEGQILTEDVFNKAKGFMTFNDIQQIANFMEVLKKAGKPLIEKIDKLMREDSNES